MSPHALKLARRAGRDRRELAGRAIRSLAIEYAFLGIRVNAVSQGIIQIPKHPPEADEALSDRLPPPGRVGHIGDVVDGVLLLESPDIIGEILHIDGGQTAAHRAPG
jgi:NAD(P)-dependent dehydrogenase (short-subunit alcohol dehydrogenase family)